jgi:DNA-directed RNA polymerase subunit beta'
MAEWDPYTRPILTEVDGVVIRGSVDGVSVQERPTRRPASPSASVIDWRTTQRGNDLKPAVVIKGKDGEIPSCRVVATPA